MSNEWDKWKPLSPMYWESGLFSWSTIFNSEFTVGNSNRAIMIFSAEVGRT